MPHYFHLLRSMVLGLNDVKTKANIKSLFDFQFILFSYHYITFAKMNVTRNTELAQEHTPDVTPILALKQGSCFLCWNSASQLKRCTGCKRVSYCSPECQKKDWNTSHKKICQFLIASNEKRTSTSTIGRNWEVFYREKVHLKTNLFCNLPNKFLAQRDPNS